MVVRLVSGIHKILLDVCIVTQILYYITTENRADTEVNRRYNDDTGTDIKISIFSSGSRKSMGGGGGH